MDSTYTFSFVTSFATDADRAAYAELITILLPERVIVPDAAVRLLASPFDHVLFVREASSGVLVATGRLHVKLEPEGSSASLEDVVVHPAHRRRGIARGMVERLHARAREEKALWIELTSKEERQAAHALYRSFGYLQVDVYVFKKVPPL